MKYIDAELLRKEIEKHIKEVKDAAERFTPNIGFFDAKLSGIYDVMAIIDSLQQEQPGETCKTCGFYENNCPYIRGKMIPYPNRVCEDYTYSVMKAQEQPVEGLEEEMDEMWLEYCEDVDYLVYASIARHFAEWGVEHAKK